MTPQSPLDFADVQGMVRFGYGRLRSAHYELVRVRQRDAARAWLRGVRVASAATADPPPETAVQVALTAAGLAALGLDADVLAQFAPEFLSGMVEDNRSRRLGDVGPSAPSHWIWGGPEGVPHVLVMCFARPDMLSAFVTTTKGAGWDDAFETVRTLATSDLGGVEPFGFADGISQPHVDWEQRRDVAALRPDYSNTIALGEILLGYRNEYGRYSDRPLLDAHGAGMELPPAAEAPERRDLGRNGTYLVMRQLRQDVRGFWQFVQAQSSGSAETAERLAAAMVGRTRAGDPLVPPQSEPIDGIDDTPDAVRRNRFTFDGDPDGARCPFGAHVRRANPRTVDYPGRETGLARLVAALGFRSRAFRDDLISSVRFHRVLRRGREYGPWLAPEDARLPAPPGDPERGLFFICLNANIARQFEFLQQAWMISTTFAGLAGESDPLLGHRQPVPGCPVTDAFGQPRANGVRHRVTGLPTFVTVRGGAYFFLPGLRALRFLGRAADRPRG